MTENQMAMELAAAISFSLLVVILRLFWSYHVDALRENLFALRDEIMLYAFDHNLIEDTAYRNLRILMNGLIRYAHRFSFLKLVVMDVGRRRLGISLKSPAHFLEWRNAVAKLPEEQRKQFKRFNQEAVHLIVAHMALRSPLVWIMAVFIIAHAKVIRPTKAIWDNTVKALAPKMHIDLAFAAALKTTQV
jgi:hypothetical protein